METIWNNFELKAPPLLTLTAKQSRFVTQLHGLIENFIAQHSKYEEQYNETAALLSRLMAKRKNSFRRMHGFKHICKVNSALCRLLRLGYKRDLENFRSTLPDVAYRDGTDVYLPTRDCFDYLLLRSIALHELYKRICCCCLPAAAFCNGNIKLNCFIEISVVMYAVIAKVYNLSGKFNHIATNFYNDLLRYREYFPKSKKSLFLKDVVLDFPPLTTEPLSGEGSKVHEMESKDPASIEESLLKMQSIADQSVRVKSDCLRKTDIGTLVKRPTTQQSQKTFNIEKLKTIQGVQRFISNEGRQRAMDLSSSLTKAILPHEWQGAIKLFKKKVDSGQRDEKTIRFFQKFLNSKIK